jgi:hypothetical protein
MQTGPRRVAAAPRKRFFRLDPSALSRAAKHAPDNVCSQMHSAQTREGADELHNKLGDTQCKGLKGCAGTQGTVEHSPFIRNKAWVSKLPRAFLPRPLSSYAYWPDQQRQAVK